MLLRHGNSAGQGIVDVRPEASVPVEELLEYDLLRAFGATVADLEQVIIDGYQIQRDGTMKQRFNGHFTLCGPLCHWPCGSGHQFEAYLSRSLRSSLNTGKKWANRTRRVN